MTTKRNNINEQAKLELLSTTKTIQKNGAKNED